MNTIVFQSIARTTGHETAKPGGGLCGCQECAEIRQSRARKARANTARALAAGLAHVGGVL